MLRYSTAEATRVSTGQIEAELQRTAYVQQLETGRNPAAMRYSDVKREFEASLNFKLYCTFGSFVSIITHPDGTTKEAILCKAREFEDYYAEM